MVRKLVYASLLLGLLSCTATDRETQVTIGLSSETEIPKELDSFTLRVFSTRTGELRFSQDYSPKSGRDFPTTLAVIPVDSDSLKSPLRIELEGRKGAQTKAFLRRTAVMPYIEGRNILLNMPLRMACFQFQDCGANETCSGGQCVSSTVDATKLPNYEDRLVFPSEGNCFDEEACLSDSKPVNVAEDCSFPLPEGSSLTLGNASIQWAAAPDRILTLESDDAQEGWTRIDAARGRLSQGACDSHFQRRGPDNELLVKDWAKTVLFSNQCKGKVMSLPFCVSKRTGHAGIGARTPTTTP